MSALARLQFSDAFTLIRRTAMSVENQEFRFTSAHPKSDEEQRVTQRWLSETPVIVIGLLLFSTCIGLLVSKGIYPTLEGVWVNLRLFVLFVIVIAAFDAAIQLYQRRPRSPIEHLKGRYFNSQVHATCLAGGPMLAIAIVLLPYFSKMKAAIPLFQPYTWDTAFAQWDRAIFFGNDAWQVLQPMLGFPIVTAFLALLYQLWFLLLYPGVLFFAFARVDGLVRRQFFLSYVLSWTLIGGLMATLLASVGPCFVGPILGDPSFDEQMAYLESANESYPVMVLKVQTMLLERFATAEDGLGSGITAMPSMHCAIAFLFWLAMRRVSERWGAFFGVFFFVTWLSSVHLAYHYAVDGLVSLLAVAAIWAASQRIIMAWDTWLERHETLRTNTAPAE